MAEWVDRLAAELVAQLQPHLPPDVQVYAEGTGPTLMVRCSDAATGFGRLACQGGDLSRVRRAETAVRATLDAAQDWAARATTKPWPAEAGVMPSLRVDVDEAGVQAAFGDDVVIVVPMDLSEPD